MNDAPIVGGRRRQSAHFCLAQSRRGLASAATIMIAAGLVLGAPAILHADSATAQRGMVASAHPLATDAGVNVLRSGGNAIDAAVAVGLTLGVVDADNSGIGGGCLMLLRLADGKLVAIDGRETAPGAATRDMFIRDGKADLNLSQTGSLAIGVPGEVAAFEHAIEQFGRKKFRDLVLPAAEIATYGFTVDRGYAARLASVAEDMARFPPSRAVFFEEGKPVKAGVLFKQPDLAATYRALAQRGSEWFYRGPFAAATEKWMKATGGILSARDFASYRVRIREPITTTYRGFDIVTFPPPSSGGVHLSQMLNILEAFDLKSLDDATRLHVIAEAMKFAFADRAYWLGDPDFAKVPRGLVSKDYALTLGKQIQLERTTEVAAHGQPPNWNTDIYKHHTTHWSVADAEGNWVACTATVNTSFGSKVVIPGTGVVMNNEMDDFSAQPGAANYFGLIGAEANAVAPGKRPLSSMTPTMVLKDGKPIIAIGASGGPKIISTVLTELIGMLDLQQSPAEALAAPRIHHQWAPNELMVERTFPDKWRWTLEQRGHVVKVLPALSTSQVVARDPQTGEFIGVADPRVSGKAAGW